MKKSKSLIVMLISVLFVCLAFAACGNDNKPAAEYSLDKTEITLVVGDTHQIEVKSTQSGQFTATYESDSPACASVSDTGLVTAAAPGTATVKVTVDGKELSLSVTVEHKYELNKTTETLEEGDTVQLSVKTTPNKNVTPQWSVSPADVASVSDSGLVTALKEGTATVTAKVDGKELKCTITVTEKSILYIYTLNHTSTNLEKGKTLQLELTCDPEQEGMEVTWESDNTAAVTVSENGLVTAAAVGTANVNAKVGGDVVATCKVTAFEYVYTFETELELDYGDDSKVLGVTITPEKPININYTVDSDDVIEIDANGAITTVGVGTATVTVKDGETVLGTCEVQVKAVITVEQSVQLHVGDTYVIEVTCSPDDDTLEVEYEITEGTDVLELGADNETLTALKNGTATVLVKVGGAEKECTVLVDNVNATVEATDISEGTHAISGDDVEYWEQYINTNEINHKAIVNPDEDIIERTWGDGQTNYFGDYATLSWTGGDSTCAKPEKPDGFREGALISVFGGDATATLSIKAYKGESTLKVYTGAFKGKNVVTLYSGETAIASSTIVAGDSQQQVMLTFALDLMESATITVKLELTEATADNSWLSLVAASITGDTYRVNKSSVRIAPEGTSQITVTKNGEEITEGVSYEVTEGASYIEVSESGLITGKAIGDAVVTATVDGRQRVINVTVGYSYSLNKANVQLHTGHTFKLEAVSDPAGSTATAEFEVVSGDDVISIGGDGTITALANGTARVKVTIDGGEYYADVLVNDVTATATVEKLAKDKENPIDITAGAEYWEQYIANGEINHKHYFNAEEDIITRSCDTAGNYLSDYPAFLSWSGGATSKTCDCGACAKDAHTTPDGGWNGDAGTKAYAVNVKDAVISLNIKVFAGSSVIKVYTGGYNLTGMLTLKAGGVTLATATFDNKGAHNAQCVSFAVDTVEDTEIVIEVVMTNDYGNAPHSCISIAAVTVSGDTYQLARKSARIIPDGTANVVLNKNGEALTEGVTYEVTEGVDVASINQSGVVTGLKVGTATVKVTANGRERYFTVEVGYSYSLEDEQIKLKPGETYQVNVISDPVGATVNATYLSNDTDIATVSATGLITAVANGATVINVTVDGTELEIAVMVSGIEVSVRHEETAGKIVDLTSSDVIYWEHYLYNELNPKALGEGERDLIDGNVDGKNGDAGSTTKFYFTGSRGPKENCFNDEAWHKYSWGTGYEFNITVPVGTYEIRVYTGVWKTVNKTALYDGDAELASYTFERTADGINMLVAFNVTATTEKVLKLKIESLGGDNNCRLNAIAIVDMTAGKTTLELKGNNTIEANSGKVVDLTADGILDWAIYGGTNREKADADMIKTDTFAQGTNYASGTADDFRAELKWGEGEDDKTRDFKWNDEYVSVQVGVDSSVKTMSVYMSGYNADYFIVVTDGSGKVVATVFVNRDGGNSVAKEIVFDVNATAADTLTVKVCKLGGSNCGLAGIVLEG